MSVGMTVGAVAVASLVVGKQLFRKEKKGAKTKETVAPLPKLEVSKAMWDTFSVDYDKMFRLWSLPALASMISALQLEKAASCLEIGCGAGHGLAMLRDELGSNGTLSACDFSPEMVKLAKARVKQLGGGVALSSSKAASSPTRSSTPRRKRAPATPDSKKEAHERVLEDLEAVARGEEHIGPAIAKIFEADAQDLPADWTDKFERVVSCLCFHIVPDHKKATAEMFRVTAPGGLAAFAVWGQKDDSPMFTLHAQAIASLREKGAIGPPSAEESAYSAALPRSNFYLGSDDAQLRADVAGVGFVDVLSWHVHCVWSTQGRGCNAFARAFTSAQPNARKYMENFFTGSERELIITEMARLADENAAAGKPIGCDLVVVYGRKP